MTALVKLPTAGGEQQVRVFSLRGAHLLGMFARTDKAASFRKWVLDILDAHVAQPTITLANRRWLISFDEAGRELVEPVARDAHILTASEFARALSEPGIFTRHELLEIVNAANQRLYQAVCNDGAPGIGDQVVKLINRDLPQSDLRQIVTSAALELWMRSPVFDSAK